MITTSGSVVPGLPGALVAAWVIALVGLVVIGSVRSGVPRPPDGWPGSSRRRCGTDAGSVARVPRDPVDDFWTEAGAPPRPGGGVVVGVGGGGAARRTGGV
jgi:hypothetical protein